MFDVSRNIADQLQIPEIVYDSDCISVTVCGTTDHHRNSLSLWSAVSKIDLSLQLLTFSNFCDLRLSWSGGGGLLWPLVFIVLHFLFFSSWCCMLQSCILCASVLLIVRHFPVHHYQSPGWHEVHWTLCYVPHRILWTAGAVAAVGSITYPAISVYVSANASPDQQGHWSDTFIVRLVLINKVVYWSLRLIN